MIADDGIIPKYRILDGVPSCPSLICHHTINGLGIQEYILYECKELDSYCYDS